MPFNLLAGGRSWKSKSTFRPPSENLPRTFRPPSEFAKARRRASHTGPEPNARAAGSGKFSSVASGGGTNSELLMTILASVLQRPVRVSPVKEAAALGAAMLAATGAGWFSDAHAASVAMCQPAERTVEPDGRLVGAYAKQNSIYCDYYRAIQPVQAALAALRT